MAEDILKEAFDGVITVEQLIGELKKIDPSMMVLVDGYEQGFERLHLKETTAYPVMPAGAYTGEFDEPWFDGDVEHTVKVLVISREKQ